MDKNKKKANEKEQTKLMFLYGTAWASLILACIPTISFAIVATIIFIGLLIATYIVRKKSDKESLTHNHKSFVIRSLWLGIFFFPAITLTFATIYLLPNYDPGPMLPCTQEIANHIVANPDQQNYQFLASLIAPCMDAFMRVNGQAFLIATLIAALPIFIYLIYRFGKGTMAAYKGKKISNLKNWF